jgi:pimeloyl-ACP methyl ester carboxylesterase
VRVSVLESLALRPLDAGDLKMAHWLEGAGLLMVAAAMSAGLATIDGAGHYPQTKSPAEVAALVTPFLKDNARA